MVSIGDVAEGTNLVGSRREGLGMEGLMKGDRTRTISEYVR